MSKQTTDITIVLDRSGSMGKVQQDTIGGFNAFVKDQAALPGEATLSLTTFNESVTPDYAGKQIKSTPLLNEVSYRPAGGTALLDAIGRTIIATGNRLSAIPEDKRPEKVLFVIFTDGEENSSKEFDYKQISDMITHQRDIYKWQILFIGADQDAIATAAKVGIKRDQAISTANNAIGTQALYAKVSLKTASYRAAGGESSGVSWDDQDRQEQKDAGSKF